MPSTLTASVTPITEHSVQITYAIKVPQSVYDTIAQNAASQGVAVEDYLKTIAGTAVDSALAPLGITL